jgi:hypothetical protein
MEQPSTPWDDSVDFDEAVARFKVIIHERIRGLDPLQQFRIWRSERREARFTPLDGTWLALWIRLDGDEAIGLGIVARAAFRKQPPSPS